jgi:hypothetical protein
VEDDSSWSTAPNSAPRPHFQQTYGEVLPDATIVDLVAEGKDLLLCHYDGTRTVVLPYLDLGNIVYSPPRLAPSIRKAVRFPGVPVECGSVRALFQEIVAVLEKFGFARDDAYWFSVVVLATWVPELFPDPPTFLVYGSDLSLAALLFAFLASLCRRGLTTAELSRHLPFSILPTLFVLSTELSARQRAFWSASNFRSVQVPCRGGAVENLAGPRILFTCNADSLSTWGSNVLPFTWLPRSQIAPPTERELAKIAEEFQPKLLMFRLRRLRRINVTQSQKTQVNKFSTYPLARKLLAERRAT